VAAPRRSSEPSLQCVEELRLDTGGGDAAALALFRSAGFERIADYNGNPHARYWFTKRLP
jgi:hypothetical protein